MSTGWSWGWRTVLVAAAVGCTAAAVDVHGPLPRGTAIALVVSAAGVPAPGVVRVDEPWLWWTAHVLFWIPLVSWALVRLQLLPRRLSRRWLRQRLHSGDPARRAAAQERGRHR